MKAGSYSQKFGCIGEIFSFPLKTGMSDLECQIDIHETYHELKPDSLYQSGFVIV